MNSLHSRNLSLALGALVLAVAGAACSSKGGEKHDNTPPPPTVIVADVVQKTVPIYSEFVGQTKAEETVELRARVEGVLQKVYFREGSPVRKGQLLFTIDKRPFEAGATVCQGIGGEICFRSRTGAATHRRAPGPG
jgi:multidrug efflux pump subunit AcrA (membrane-fusion protein)